MKCFVCGSENFNEVYMETDEKNVVQGDTYIGKGMYIKYSYLNKVNNLESCNHCKTVRIKDGQ